MPNRVPGRRVGLFRMIPPVWPAGWVAGDFYDVFRLDERHVGFYIADAVGHGVPAALLTIFVKHSLQTKRIVGRSYELIPPGEALSLFNADLISADLHQSPFISMVYCVIDAETGVMTYARAGHPRPLHLTGQAAPRELPADGPLLGVMSNAVFEPAECQIEPGQRLLLYTDGVERCQTDGVAGTEAFLQIAARENQAGREVYLQTLLDAVLRPRDNDPIADDVTMVAMDFLA